MKRHKYTEVNNSGVQKCIRCGVVREFAAFPVKFVYFKSEADHKSFFNGGSVNMFIKAPNFSGK